MKWIHRPARIEHTKERFDVKDGQFDLEITESDDGSYYWRCEHHQPVYRDGSFEESDWSSDPESTNWFLLQGAASSKEEAFTRVELAKQWLESFLLTIGVLKSGNDD